MSAIKYVIEIATTDFTSTKAAVDGGADRIELCSALSEGGITPSMGLIKQCRSAFNVALFPIIRPRSGDFLYTQDDFEIVKKDALLCKELGCDGVVIGFLNRDGSVNKAWTSEIVEAVYPLEVTFHRAFDRCSDPFEGLAAIIEAGCQRILTSGQKKQHRKGSTSFNNWWKKRLIGLSLCREAAFVPKTSKSWQNIPALWSFILL